VHESGAGFDLVLFSYALSMFNPGWEQAIDAACMRIWPRAAASPSWISPTPRSAWFPSLDGRQSCAHGGPPVAALAQKFVPLLDERLPAYLGVWQYGMFIGRKLPTVTFSPHAAFRLRRLRPSRLLRGYA
jgi:S-adenosylmethionine-diacylgycerolhomoserine-N-methlytransferase